MKLLTTLFTYSLVLVLSITANGQGFSISPSRLFFKGNPGETVSQIITFSNTSESVLNFTMKIQDWDRDSVGTKIYYSANTKLLSNAEWLALPSNSIKIHPGEAKQINVTLKIPQDASRLTNSMLFFTQVKEQKPPAISAVSLGINLLLEVGVQIYYIPKNLSPGELEFISFNDLGYYEKENSRRLVLKIHNNGGLNKDAIIRVELTNKFTGEEIKVEHKSIAMLPGATQIVNLDLPSDLRGKYHIVAILDAGNIYDLKVAEKEITYRP